MPAPVWDHEVRAVGCRDFAAQRGSCLSLIRFVRRFLVGLFTVCVTTLKRLAAMFPTTGSGYSCSASPKVTPEQALTVCTIKTVTYDMTFASLGLFIGCYHRLRNFHQSAMSRSCRLIQVIWESARFHILKTQWLNPIVHPLDMQTSAIHKLFFFHSSLSRLHTLEITQEVHLRPLMDMMNCGFWSP